MAIRLIRKKPSVKEEEKFIYKKFTEDWRHKYASSNAHMERIFSVNEIVEIYDKLCPNCHTVVSTSFNYLNPETRICDFCEREL